MALLAIAVVCLILSMSFAIMTEMFKFTRLLWIALSTSSILCACSSSTIRFVSCFAITAAVTPAVVMEAAPMAVPISMGPDTKNLFGLEIAVPFVCFKNSVVKPSNIDVISGNFLVAFSFGVHFRP